MGIDVGDEEFGIARLDPPWWRLFYFKDCRVPAEFPGEWPPYYEHRGLVYLGVVMSYLIHMSGLVAAPVFNE